MNINNNNLIVGMIFIPLIALAVVIQLYIFLPLSANLQLFLDGATDQNIGLLTSAFGLFYAFGLIIWGGLSDKFGRETVLILGLTLLAAMSFLLPLSSDYKILLFERSLQGFCAASFPPVAMSWLTENLSLALRTKAIALISCAFLLAGSIGQTFGTIMITDSLHQAMWSLSCIYILAALLFVGVKYYINKQKREKSNANTSLLRVFSQLPAILFDQRLFKVYLCALFVLLSYVCLFVTLSSAISQTLVSTLRHLGIAAILLSLTSSYVFKIIKPLYVLALSLLLMASSLLFHSFYMSMQFGSEITLFVAHFIFTAGLAYSVPSMITCVAMLSGQEIRGIAISLYTFILFVGASIGALLPQYIEYTFLIPCIALALLLCAIQLLRQKTTEEPQS